MNKLLSYSDYSEVKDVQCAGEKFLRQPGPVGLRKKCPLFLKAKC